MIRDQAAEFCVSRYNRHPASVELADPGRGIQFRSEMDVVDWLRSSAIFHGSGAGLRLAILFEEPCRARGLEEDATMFWRAALAVAGLYSHPGAFISLARDSTLECVRQVATAALSGWVATGTNLQVNERLRQSLEAEGSGSFKEFLTQLDPSVVLALGKTEQPGLDDAMEILAEEYIKSLLADESARQSADPIRATVLHELERFLAGSKSKELLGIPDSVAEDLRLHEESAAAVREALGANSPSETLNELFVHLTPREREIMEMKARGMKAKDIAKKLGIDPATVSRHTRAAMEKLQGLVQKLFPDMRLEEK